MVDQDIRITKQTQEHRFNGNDKPKLFVRVTFYVGDDGPFTEDFSKEAFDPNTRDQVLNDFARKVRH